MGPLGWAESAAAAAEEVVEAGAASARSMVGVMSIWTCILHFTSSMGVLYSFSHVSWSECGCDAGEDVQSEAGYSSCASTSTRELSEGKLLGEWYPLPPPQRVLHLRIRPEEARVLRHRTHDGRRKTLRDEQTRQNDPSSS